MTGDELVDAGRPLAAGQIRNSNGPAIEAQALAAGAAVTGRAAVGDDYAATVAALESGLAADVVVTTGGVSVGQHDHVKPALEELGVEEVFWGVALRPGHPTWFGTRDRKLVFGLPGNPVSAMVTFHLFVRPALAAMMGLEPRSRRPSRCSTRTTPRARAARTSCAAGSMRATTAGTSAPPRRGRAHTS